MMLIVMYLRDIPELPEDYDVIKELDTSIAEDVNRAMELNNELKSEDDPVPEGLREMVEHMSEYSAGCGKEKMLYKAAILQRDEEIERLKDELSAYKEGPVPDPRRIAIRIEPPKTLFGSLEPAFNRVFLETYFGGDLSAIPDHELPKVTELETLKTPEGEKVSVYEIRDKVAQERDGKETGIQILYLKKS